LVRVLGIDPGSRVTGWGVVERSGRALRYVASGTISTARCRSFPARLRAIHDGVRGLLREWRPDAVGLEQAFVARNVQAALRLGEARGAVLVSVATEDVEVHEYAPATVKLAVAGSGSADKAQVARGVGQLLGIEKARGGDATDALAVAVCHAHSSHLAAHVLKHA
jgi:crossover junction endodeoxyribonuclease RuvC